MRSFLPKKRPAGGTRLPYKSKFKKGAPMGLTDIIILAVIAILIGGAVFYVLREKKKGRKCIGCPYADSCTKCNCGSDKK